MKAPIIEIAGYEFACKSVSQATELAKLLSGLTRVKFCHSDSYRDVWYEEQDDADPLRVKLLLSKEVRKQPKRLALPAPKRGAIPCLCGRGTVRPGEHCPSCDLHYHNICEARQS